MITKLFLGSLFFGVSFGAYAGTTTNANFKTPCTYVKADGDSVSDKCKVLPVTFGVNSGAQWDVTFSNGAYALIGVNAEGDLATVNQIPAQVITYGGKVVAVTEEGEIFIINND